MYYRHYWIAPSTQGYCVMWHATALATLSSLAAARAWIDNYLKS